MAQVVELAQVLLPAVVYDVEHDGFLKLLHHILGLSAVCLLEVARYVVYALAVGYGHHDSLVYLALSLLYLLYCWPCHTLYAVCLALECRHGFLEGAFLEVGVSVVLEFVFGERTFHSQHFEELLAASFIVIGLYDVHHAVPDDVGYVHADAFAHESVAAFLIDYGTLLVHHVVVFKQVLTYSEVVFLHFLLCALHAL